MHSWRQQIWPNIINVIVINFGGACCISPMGQIQLIESKSIDIVCLYSTYYHSYSLPFQQHQKHLFNIWISKNKNVQANVFVFKIADSQIHKKKAVILIGDALE